MPYEMAVNDVKITTHIFDEFTQKFSNAFTSDVVIVGAGPSGLTAARYLALENKKVIVFERNLSPGGGMWGGGMVFPVIIVQTEGKEILEEVGVRCTKKHDYFIADSIEASAKLIAGAIDAGATIFNGMMVEDVVAKHEKICGVVINWTGVLRSGMHVDPLSLETKAVVDGTGHPCEICRIVERKMGLKTVTGKIEGEKAMWADEGEKKTLENTGEVYPGLWVTGMAANAVMGAPRMGPIFGGMLLSGKKAAEMILKQV
jgi:thiamine thiazole synthase